MDVNITLALIAFATLIVSSIVTPIAVGYFQYRIKQAERRDDKIERGEVATALSTRSGVVDKKLSDIHTYVNSNLSAVLASLHKALMGQAQALRDNLDIRQKLGEAPNKGTLTVLEALEEQIASTSERINQRQVP